MYTRTQETEVDTEGISPNHSAPLLSFDTGSLIEPEVQSIPICGLPGQQAPGSCFCSQVLGLQVHAWPCLAFYLSARDLNWISMLA